MRRTIVLALLVVWLRASPGAAAARPGRPRVVRGDPRPLLSATGKRSIRVGMLGSAIDEHEIPSDLQARLAAFGTEVARAGETLVQGSCPGMPHVVAQAAHAAGGTVVGVSPARSLAEHVGTFKMPADSLSVLSVTGSGGGPGFIEREGPLVEYSDILAYAGGRSGTLGELAAGLHGHKVIALLEDSGGVTDAARTHILPHLGRSPAVVVADRDPVALLAKAHRALEHLDRTAPTAPAAASATARSRGIRSPSAQGSSPTRTPILRRLALDPARDQVYAFFGHEDGMTALDRARLDRFVDRAAAARGDGRRNVLLAPARTGLTAQVAARARAAGATTIGISSARSRAEHQSLGHASEGFDALYWARRGGGVGEFSALRKVVDPAQIVLVAGGDYKTLAGLVFGLYRPTVVAVLETEGLSGRLRHEILSSFDKEPQASVLFDHDPDRLFQAAQAEAERLRGEQRGVYITAQ
jgi:predicted Rossmann-fold nucleotide-binding protein